MQKDTNRAHRKLARDTVDKRVRFRLYKSGRNWVIAGMTTFIFGIGIYSTPQLVKADTIDESQTNGDESSIVNQSSVTLQTPPAAADDSSTTHPPVADQTINEEPSVVDPVQTPEQAPEPSVTDPVQTPEQTTGATEQSVDTTAEQAAATAQANVSTNETNAAVSEPENVSDAGRVPDSTNSADSKASSAPVNSVASNQPEVSTEDITSVVDPGPQDTNQANNSTQSINSVAPAMMAVTEAMPDEPPAPVPFVVADPLTAPAAGNVSAVTVQAIDVTDLFLHQSNPSNSWHGNSSLNTANVNQVIWRISKTEPNISPLNAYYDVATNTMRNNAGEVMDATAAELAYLKALMSGGDVYDLVSKLHVTATNTRTIDGQVTLTKDSKVTISLDSGTLNLNGGTLYYTAGFFVYGEHYSQSFNVWNIPITGNTGYSVGYQAPTVVNDSQVIKSANGGITIPNISVVHELYPNASTGGTESYALYNALRVTINAPASVGMSDFYYRYDVNLTTRASYVTLTPTITKWDGSSSTMTGTGTGIGDTITIKSSDGTKTATTTVGAGGIWSLDLARAGFDTLDAIYVIESNSLGDTPGAVAAPQLTLDQSHRIIEYRDAITGDVIDGVTTDKTYINQGTAETSQGTKTVTLPVNTAGNAVSGLIKDLSLAATTVDSSWVEDPDMTFDAVSADQLPVYANYLVQTEDVPAFTVARNDTGTQIVYYYPLQITVDPNTEDQITGSIPPADENTQLSTEDPNSPLYPKGVSSDDLTKTITQTIHYVDETGNVVVPDTVAGLYYTRTATIGLNADGTTKVVYANWILKTITTDGVEVKAQAGDNGFVAVTSPQASNSSGDLIPDRYQIAAVAVTDAMQGNDGEAGKDYPNIEATVTYYPATITVSTPTANGDPVTSESDPRRYPEITATDLNKVVNETVHYVFVDENGQVTGPAADDHQATPINFARTASITYHYDDTGQLIADVPVFSSWTASNEGDTFASVASPKIDGYTSTGDVDAVTVTGSSADIEKRVAYFNNDNLTHDVIVTTNYLEPVNEQDSQTYHFYRQPTATVAADGTTTFELSAWTTNSDGVSQNIADQSVTLNAIDDSKNPNDQRWVSTTTVTVDGAVDPTTTDGVVTFSGDTTTVVRDVAYTDTFMHIVYIDVDAGGIQIGETREEPAGAYSTRNSDFNVLGAAPKGSAYIYFIDPAGIAAESGTFGGTGNGAMESFEGVAGQTYTIELRHVHVTSTLQTTRSIEYVYADQTEAEKTASQTANWTSDTDLVVYQSDKGNATTYHLASGYPALDSPTITNFTPDILTVPAQTGVADSTDVPQNPTVKVTYTQTTFTPEAPGDYGANLTYQAIRQINYVNGVNDEIIQSVVPQTVTYQRTYVIDDIANNIGHYTVWTTDKSTFDAVVNPTIDNFVTIEADVAEKAVTAPSNDAQVSVSDPEVVTVKYYPTTITVTADSPKDEGESTVPGNTDSPQYPAGVAEAGLNLTVTRTIHYVNQSGDSSFVMPEDTVQTIKFTRDATITYGKDDAGNFTSSVEYSSWTAVDGETLVAVRPPEVTGLIAGVYQVDEIDVPAATISASTQQQYYYYLQDIDVTPDAPHTQGDKDDNADNVIPGDPKSPEYPTGVAANDLNKQITQTINYVDESGNALVDPANGESSTTVVKDFQRTAHIHYAYDAQGVLVGTVTYDDWNTQSFEAVEAPAIDGYVAPADQVPAISKTGDDADFTATIKYFNADLLQRAVTVATEYAAYTDNNGASYPAHNDEIQTVTFYRLPTFQNGNFGFTVWTTNTDGQTASQADQSQTIAPADLTVANALDSVTNPNGNSFIATAQILITPLNNPEGTTTNTTQIAANTAVVVEPSMASVTRLISYADNAYHIQFIDVTGLDVADYATNGKQIGTTQNVGPSYQMDTADIPHWGLLKLVNDSAALAGEGDDAIINADGSESFTGVKGQTYRIEVVHVIDADPLTTTRTIEYIKAGEAAGSAADSVVQTINWTKNTDLYIKATGDASMPVTININPNGVFYNQADQIAEVPAVKSPLTAADATDSQKVANDLSEYLPDITEVAAIAPISGFFKEEPKDSTVTVTYMRNIFTPENPDTDGTKGAIDKLQTTVNRTINYVNGLDQTQVLAAPDVQPVTYTRTYNAQTDAYSDWILNTGDSYPEQITPSIPGFLTAVLVTPGATPKDTLAPDTDLSTVQESVVVKYYPEKVVIKPDDSVTAGDSINTDHPDDTDAPVYPATVTDADLHATVTQTITYINGPTGETVGQAIDHLDFIRTATVTFTRDANGQLVGTLSYDPWQNADDNISFPEVPTPERPDQFPDQLSIAATTVNASELDAITDPTGKVDVTALNQANTHTVTYWPNTVSVTPGAPDDPDKSGKPSDPSKPDSPLLPEGVDYADLHSIVTQIIEYVDGRDGTVVHEQATATLTFERTALVHYDQRDDNGVPTVTYTDWTPVVGGSDYFVATDNPTGVTDANGEALQAATKQSAEQSVDLTKLTTEASTLTETVNYYPTTLVVTPDAPHDSGTDTGGVDSPLYPAGVDDDALHATVTEVIKYVDGSGAAAVTMPETYSTTKIYQRTATITYDENWQASVSYSDWTVANGNDLFAAVASPDVPEMWADPSAISEQKVDVTQIPITAVDNDGTELAFEVKYYPDTIIVDPHDPKTEGTPTQTDPNSPKYPAGVDTDSLNTTVTQIIHYVDQRDGGTTTTPDHTATLNFVRIATISFAKDGTSQVSYSAWTPDLANDATAEEIAAAGTFVAVENPTLTTATSDQLSLIVGASGQTTAAQPVDLASILANNQSVLTTDVAYYPAVIIVQPNSPKDAGEETVPGDANSPKYPEGVSDADLTHQVTRVIQYINKQTGEVLGTETQTASATRSAAITYQTLDGVPTIVYSPWKINGELGSVASPEYPDLYAAIPVVDAQSLTAEDFDVSRNFADVIVNYYPTVVTVTSDKPQDSGTPVVDGDEQGPKYPEGVSANDLTHQVVRQIEYVDAKGNTLGTKEQTQTYTRDATLVYTNGSTKPTITYTDWVGNFEFVAVDNPEFKGYFTMNSKVDAQIVTTSDVEDSREFGVTVKYYATEVKVTPDDPKDAGTPVVDGDEQGPKYPEGVSASDLNKTMTQTIQYVDQAGNIVAKTHVSTLNFTRFATITFDAEGNATVSYSDWTPVTTGTFAAVTSPVIDGLTTSTKVVNAQNADPNAEDVVLTVTYVAVVPAPQPTPKPQAPTSPTPATPAPQVVTPQSVTPAPATKQAVKPTALPQMGDEQAPTTSIIGLILATLMGALGFAGTKRRKRQ